IWVDLQEAAVRAAAEAKTVAAAPPAPAAYDPVELPAETLAVDPVVAPAQTHPWWLKPYETAAVTPAGQDEPIPIPPRAEPTTADQGAALITAVWGGGAALAAAAPDPGDEDEERPRRLPEQEEE